MTSRADRGTFLWSARRPRTRVGPRGRPDLLASRSARTPLRAVRDVPESRPSDQHHAAERETVQARVRARHGTPSRFVFQQSIDHGHRARPTVRLNGELLATGAGNRIEAGATVVFAGAPLA